MRPSSATAQVGDRQRHNLTEPLTSFVGREREVVEIERRLSQTRLLTLVGAGGVGKTRLALQVGRAVLATYPDGVWWVELLPLADASTIGQAIAAVLGAQQEPSRDLTETLIDLLRERQVLLVLDNCEHLVVGVRALADRLLRACPSVTMLATSRELLGVQGEAVHRVPSLSVPDAPGGTERSDVPSDGAAEVLLRSEAARLFVERARAVQEGFSVTDANARWVAQICRRLDGIPLAIELAAARTRILTPQQIAARLDDRFRLLTGGSQASLGRHQTLRATLDWSHGLLADDERAVLRRLSVFAGGCTLEAAEAVCDADGRGDVLDLLAQLADKSLVVVDMSGAEARYSLLETMRAYGLEHLAASGEAAKIRRRHAAYFLDLAQRADAELHGPEQAEWADRLAAEHENIRAALDWTLGAGDDPVTALRLGAALGWFWFVRSLLSEARWLEAALAATADLIDAETVRLRAACLSHLAWLNRTWRMVTYPVEVAERSLALSRSIGDRAAEAYTLTIQAMLLRDVRDFPRARAAAERGIAIGREVGADRTVAHGLYALASVLFVESYVPRESSAVWSVPLAVARAEPRTERPDGDLPGLRVPVYPMRDPETDRPLVPGALPRIDLLEESLAISRRLGDIWGIAVVLSGGGGLSTYATLSGDASRAKAVCAEAFALYARIGDRRNQLAVVRHLANTALSQGQINRAEHLMSAFKALYDSTGIIVPIPMGAWPGHGLDPDLLRTLSGLPDERYAAIWEQGRSLSLEQALAYGLGEVDPFGDDTATPVGPPAASAEGARREVSALTPREREVAILVGKGFSNRRIAEELVIAEKTAEVHARNVREKLGLESRAQIAAWAAQHGLLTPDV